MRWLLHLAWKHYVRLKNPTCKINSVELGKNIVLGKKVTIEKGCFVACGEIGKYTFINKNCIIDKSVKKIGNFCSIAYGVKIGLGTHPLNRISTHPFSFDKKYGFVKKNNFETSATSPHCIIGNDVWIGANTVILAGVKIGNGAVIGANSFVNKDVEPYSIVVGNPAKHLKSRFNDKTIINLLEDEWWNWDDAKIQDNIGLFIKQM